MIYEEVPGRIKAEVMYVESEYEREDPKALTMSR